MFELLILKKKSFHSLIIQGIVGPNNMLRDKFGWAKKCYNWIISHVTKIGHVYIDDKFQPYNLTMSI